MKNSNKKEHHGGLSAKNMLSSSMSLSSHSNQQNASSFSIDNVIRTSKQNYDSYISNGISKLTAEPQRLIPATSTQPPMGPHMKNFETMQEKGKYNFPSHQQFSNQVKNSPYFSCSDEGFNYQRETSTDSLYSNYINKSRYEKDQDNFNAVWNDVLLIQQRAYKQALELKHSKGNLIKREECRTEGKKLVNQMGDYLINQAKNNKIASQEQKEEWEKFGHKYLNYTFNEYVKELKVLGDPADEDF